MYVIPYNIYIYVNISSYMIHTHIPKHIFSRKSTNFNTAVAALAFPLCCLQDTYTYVYPSTYMSTRVYFHVEKINIYIYVNISYWHIHTHTHTHIVSKQFTHFSNQKLLGGGVRPQDPSFV